MTSFKFLPLALFAFCLPFNSEAASPEDFIDKENCTYKGFSLNGDIQIVENFPDIKVQIVENFADLHVQIVDNFPDKCGEWKIVKNFPDVKIQYVQNFPDIKVKMVSNFPGLR